MEHYVTFEQAKKLKEKGFNKPCSTVYSSKDESKSKVKSVLDLALDFEMYKENTLDDFNKYKGVYWDISRPEHWQVVDWFFEKHGIWVKTSPQNDEQDIIDWEYVILKIDNNEVMFIFRMSGFNNSHEATSVAFDYILDNLI
jgi:hypothetical protein